MVRQFSNARSAGNRSVAPCRFEVCVGTTEENELRVDRSDLASRFSRRGNRFWDGLFSGPVSGAKRKAPLRAPYYAQAAAELFRVHLLVFRQCGIRRSSYPEYRSLQKVSGARTRELCLELPPNNRASLYRGRCQGSVATAGAQR